MQVKIAIGTIAFMLTMIILGFATLLEPARLEDETGAFQGRQIENGSALFQNNCATCHGVNGKAEACFDAGGNEIGCVGRPLHSASLLCGDKSERMTQLNWSGTKDNLIRQTISSGRMGTLMPVWSQEYGGPLEPYQIEQLTSFIMNWSEDPALCGEGAPPVEAVQWPASVTDLPDGDAAIGATLYTSVTPPCSSCHGDPTQPGSNGVGPHLGNIGNDGATRIDGYTAADYIYESILNPNAFIAPECVGGNPCLEPSVMPGTFGQQLSLQDMADIIAYLLTLTGE